MEKTIACVLLVGLLLLCGCGDSSPGQEQRFDVEGLTVTLRSHTDAIQQNQGDIGRLEGRVGALENGQPGGSNGSNRPTNSRMHFEHDGNKYEVAVNGNLSDLSDNAAIVKGLHDATKQELNDATRIINGVSREDAEKEGDKRHREVLEAIQGVRMDVDDRFEQQDARISSLEREFKQGRKQLRKNHESLQAKVDVIIADAARQGSILESVLQALNALKEQCEENEKEDISLEELNKLIMDALKKLEDRLREQLRSRSPTTDVRVNVDISFLPPPPELRKELEESKVKCIVVPIRGENWCTVGRSGYGHSTVYVWPERLYCPPSFCRTIW